MTFFLLSRSCILEFPEALEKIMKVKLMFLESYASFLCMQYHYEVSACLWSRTDVVTKLQHDNWEGASWDFQVTSYMEL